MDKSVALEGHALSPEQRRAAEILLGQTIGEDEVVLVRTTKSRLLQRPLEGAARDEAFRQLFAQMDEFAGRVAHVPEAELDALIDEALASARNRSQ